MDIQTLRSLHSDHWQNACAIRTLTLDAIAAANSGHSGMPMGMADVATVLYEKHLKFVVGCHMVGEHAAEIIQGIGIAIKAGATKADFDATVGIHPSEAEEFVTMREPSR